MSAELKNAAVTCSDALRPLQLQASSQRLTAGNGYFLITMISPATAATPPPKTTSDFVTA